MIAILLGAGIVASLAVAGWNLYAGVGLSSQYDWRTDRTGLTPPGTDNDWLYHAVVASAATMIASLAHASLIVFLTIGLAYSLLFARWAIQSRRRAITWFRGNPGVEAGQQS